MERDQLAQQVGRVCVMCGGGREGAIKCGSKAFPCMTGASLSVFRQADLLPLPPPPAHFACRWQDCSSFWSSCTHPGVPHPLEIRGEGRPRPEEDDHQQRGCQEGAAEEQQQQQQLEMTGGIVPGEQKQAGQVWTSEV